MVKVSRRFSEAMEVVDLERDYPLSDAVDILARMPPAKFDETVELSAKLGVDPKQSNQMVRGMVNLPSGSGKKVRVLVFTDSADAALEAGADHAGLDDLVKKIQDGWLEFDVAVATPASMKSVRAIARILGPRGLMPNPKSGTLTNDVADTIKQIKLGGRVEFKMDRSANVGIGVGKRSFTKEMLIDNVNTVIESIGRARPVDFKGGYITALSICSTMSPGIKLDAALYINY